MHAESGKELGATDTQAAYKSKTTDHRKDQIITQGTLYL